MLRLCSLVIVMGLFVGCAPVRAWERGNLTHPCMDRQHGTRTSMGNLHDHTHDVREGFTPCNTAGAGGGCGCN